MKLKTVFYCLFTLPTLLQSRVVETKTFQDILNYLDPRKTILIVTDIDNTLLESRDYLGSATWGERMCADFKRKGLPNEIAEETENTFWNHVQYSISVQPVEPNIPKILQQLKEQKIPILGLTSRTPQIADCTLSQLESINISLDNQSLFPKISQEFPLTRTALYKKGILFGTTLNKKSDVLLAFLDRNKITPERVIFIDDKLHHVKDIEKVLQERGIDCISIRFGGADERVKNYNPDIADLQWKLFPDKLR